MCATWGLQASRRRTTCRRTRPRRGLTSSFLESTDERAVDDPALELKFCVVAIPAALLLALVFHVATPGLQRIVFGMPVHELGHALAAWFCGHAALPTPWRTLVAEERGWMTPLLLAAALGYATFRAHVAGKRYLVVLLALLLLLQAFGTFYIKPVTAEMVFTFGGDGVGMMLASALMGTFFFGKHTQLYRGSLRWGFLVIGAAAFVDMFATWWTGTIPFGEIEGTGLSDALKLIEEHGWTEKDMRRRYVTVGVACLAALTAVHAWGVRQAWKEANPDRQ